MSEAVQAAETVANTTYERWKTRGVDVVLVPQSARGKLYGVVLSGIRVRDDLRDRGLGEEALREICQIADTNGWKLALTPEGKVGRLKRWYKRHGFVLNKGRNKDFLFRDTMLRLPR